MRNKRPLILYVFPSPSSFIIKDRKILAKHFEVEDFQFTPRKKYLTPLLFIEQFVFLIKNIGKADVLFCQFAGYLSVLPVVFGKLFNKPILIVLCGSDCHSFPSIQHGAYRKKLLGFFTGWSIKHASLLTPVHKSLQFTEYTYSEAGAPYQGYKAFVPDADVECLEICNGYDSGEFFITGENRIKNSFLTVAINLEKPFFNRKGVDLIIAAAKELPNSTFTIIGRSPSVEALEIPDNVNIISPVPYHELIHFYNKHEFYLQLSMAEGFPNALCEAMLSGCVPIGSNVFGIPDIIGETGYILPQKDKDKLISIISTAVKNGPETLSKSASERIKSNYSVERREKGFLDAINSLLKKR